MMSYYNCPDYRRTITVALPSTQFSCLTETAWRGVGNVVIRHPKAKFARSKFGQTGIE